MEKESKIEKSKEEKLRENQSESRLLKNGENDPAWNEISAVGY